MALYLRYLSRGVSKSTLRNHSTIAKTAYIPEEPIQNFRTNEVNPINHTNDHLNRFYVMPSTVTNKLFSHGGLPRRFRDQVTTFVENAIMVREPAIDIISFLRRSDYSRPVNKYVLYGSAGSGKTITLAHILHYGLASKRLLVHIPWVLDWYLRPTEVAPSSTKEGFYDLPVDAAAWLAHFKHQNTPLLSELDLRLSKDYIWNAREQNLAGSSLMELIDFAIVRAKYACDIVDILMNELKLASTTGKCNTLVVIDGFNSCYGDITNVKGTDSKRVHPHKITITQALMNITKYDWCNGAIVLSVDGCAVHPRFQTEHQSIFPRCLLGKEGFEHLDPFVPVEVPNYSQDEFEAAMEYYKNRKWVRDISDDGQRELELLSNRNPYKLMRYTAPL